MQKCRGCTTDAIELSVGKLFCTPLEAHLQHRFGHRVLLRVCISRSDARVIPTAMALQPVGAEMVQICVYLNGRSR